MPFLKRSLRASHRNVLLLVMSLLLSASTMLGQTDRATINGTVTDSTGAVIPGATVTATAIATGQVRTVVTSGAGDYTIPGLAIGQYTVKVTASSFQQTDIAAFAVEVGQTRTLDVHLAPAGDTAETTVTAPAALEQTTAAVGGVLAPEQIANLPINGRNWTNLMALVPGAVDTGTGDQKSIRFAGRAQDDNYYRFDGVDATGGQNQGQRTSARLQISTDAIAEFRANSALYGADQGNSAGGQVEIVTKSGTNQLHASAFEFFRNDIFDARPFESYGLRKPPLRMNQFGATLGGPILKGRTFFFLDFEAIRQTLGTAVTGSLVPSPTFRAATLALHNELAPILNAYPQGQAVAATDATGNTFTYSGTSARRLQETSGLARIDHRLTDRTALFARFNLDRLVGDDPNGVLRDTLASLLSPYNAVIGLDHIFSPRILNSTKLGFNRSDFHSTQESALPFAVTVAGFSTLNNTIQKIAVSNIYSVLDTANFTFGRHSVKTGIEIRAVQINQSATASDDLTVAFSSVANLKANSVSAITLNSKVPLLGLRKIEDFAYVQDQFKLRPNITLTAGLRYEFYSNFHEQHGRGLVFDPRTCPTGGFCPAGSDYYFPYKLDIEPRVAVSWAPYANGKTVVTSGYGVYAGDGQLGDLNAPINNVATRVALTNAKGPLSYPVDAEIAAGLSTSLAPRGLYRNRANQQVQAWSLNVQQAVAHNTVAEFAYIGTKGTHLFTRSYINGLDPVTRIAPIAGLGLIDYKTTDSNSNFHALLVNLNREFDHGLSLKANYQWSHSINDGAVGGGEALSTENVNCRICDRASSDQDIRHYFTAGAVYQLPVGHGRQYLGSAGRLTDALLGGWQISAIGTAYGTAGQHHSNSHRQRHSGRKHEQPETKCCPLYLAVSRHQVQGCVAESRRVCCAGILPGCSPNVRQPG